MEGVLGGFSDVNEPDISCSDDFLKILLSERFPSDVKSQPLVALGTFFFDAAFIQIFTFYYYYYWNI